MFLKRLAVAAAALLISVLVSIPAGVQAQGFTGGEYVNAQTGTSYTFVATDCSKLVTFSNASAVAVTLPKASASGNFLAGCVIEVANLGAGAVTITPTTSTIGGAATLFLSANKGARIISDGTNYRVLQATATAD